MGFWDITLQFNLKKNVFVDPEAGVIPANGKYVMHFNSGDRRWYTKDRFQLIFFSAKIEIFIFSFERNFQ